MTDLPRKLSANPSSIYYIKSVLPLIDKVFVDERHIPNCVAYNMDAGWAFGKDEKGIFQPKVYGVVRVTRKQGI